MNRRKQREQSVRTFSVISVTSCSKMLEEERKSRTSSASLRVPLRAAPVSGFIRLEFFPRAFDKPIEQATFLVTWARRDARGNYAVGTPVNGRPAASFPSFRLARFDPPASCLCHRIVVPTINRKVPWSDGALCLHHDSASWAPSGRGRDYWPSKPSVVKYSLISLAACPSPWQRACSIPSRSTPRTRRCGPAPLTV